MDIIDESERKELLQEQIERLSSIYWPLKIFGFIRFDIIGDQIVQKSKCSIFMTILLLISLNLCAFYIIYELYIKTDYLFITEVLILVNFLCGQSSVSINSSFVNLRNTPNYLNTTIELDSFLGAKETMFMRDVTSNTYLFLCAVVGFFEVLILLILFSTYVVNLSVYIVGGILFVLHLFVYYDLAFFVSIFTTLPLRVRYLNIAIIKLAKVKQEYLPKQFPFNTVFWKDSFDEKVTFHLRAKTEHFTRAFIMIFYLLRRLENAYRCTIITWLICIACGLFLVVQSWIIYAKNPDVDILRVLVLTVWGVLSCSFQVIMTLQLDMFQRQINQTSLICTYIQLKPTYPDEIYELTASIIRVLEIRDPRISIYDIFYYDTGLLLRLCSSLFIYITMQLQIAFPKNVDIKNDSTVRLNGSIDTDISR